VFKTSIPAQPITPTPVPTSPLIIVPLAEDIPLPPAMRRRRRDKFLFFVKKRRIAKPREVVARL
jgi:hypothetical protein